MLILAQNTYRMLLFYTTKKCLRVILTAIKTDQVLVKIYIRPMQYSIP